MNVPDPPGHLSAECQALWRDLGRTYGFHPHEEKTLRLALEALDRANQARRALRRHGLTYEDRFGQPHARPEVAIERDSRLAWVRLMRELGLPTDEAAKAQPRERHGQWGATKGRARLEVVDALG